MNSMPYGIVQKLQNDGWVTRKDDGPCSSGRTLLTHPNHPRWKFVDNGIVNGSRWIFLKLDYCDLDFSNNWWPVHVTLTEKKVHIQPTNNRYNADMSYEDFEYVKKLMQYYKVGFVVSDTRPEYYQKQIEIKKRYIEARKKEIGKLNVEILDLER